MAGFWIDQMHAAAKRARDCLVNAIIGHCRAIYDKSLHIVAGRRAAIQESGHAAPNERIVRKKQFRMFT
jgi:hypothetical protein